MANAPSIPPVSGSRPEVPPRAAERPRAPSGMPFRAHLARSKAPALAVGVGAAKPEATLPRRPEVPPGAESRPGDVEGRARHAVLSLGERDAAGDEGGRPRFGVDPLDPMARALFSDGSHRLAFERSATFAATNVPAQPDPASLAARVSLEQVMSRFVRRVAWSGDATTGTARLELGAGVLTGATLTIHSEQGVVRVALELPPGVDGAEWRERIARRLGARGLQIAALDVE